MLRPFRKVSSLFLIASSIVFMTSCGSKGDSKGGADSTATEKTETGAGDHKQEVTKLTNSAEYGYFDAKASIQLNSITMDFFPSAGPVLSDPKADGKQFVRVEVTITNTGKEKISPAYTSFKLNTAKEKGVGLTMLVNDGNSKDCLSSLDLEPGAKGTGALYFEVDGKETVSGLTLLYDGAYENGASKTVEIPVK